MTTSSSSHSLSPLASATDMPTVRLRSNSVTTEATKASAAAVAAERMHGAPQPHQNDPGQTVSTPPAPRPPRSVYRSPPDNTWSPPSNANVPEQQSSAMAMKRLIQMALEHSKDEGETLDLSRQRMDKITDDAVEMFHSKVGKDKKGVWRLALSYNQLRDGTISPHFSSLNRLRYLNLKSNLLTYVPPCVRVRGVCFADIVAGRTSCARDSRSVQESADHLARVSRPPDGSQSAIVIRQSHRDAPDIPHRVREAESLQG